MRALAHQPDELGGVPIEAVIAVLRAEGVLEVDRSGSTRPLNEHPLFEEPTAPFPLFPQGWPRYGQEQLPRAEWLHRHTLKLAVPHADDGLADAYLQAFEKVLTHHHEFKENQAV
ncbi:hypothetical protein [Haloactinomyces albus]|uniref:Uncharacterized protein n=1 Tax=Haloactinomyces albus TaxID=1352928 RepID=A0AAE3ZID1_9ACTN|nr:hypothetical protein [Haloactinomyces albus]MDR7304205.1 hypothetical protein [Haloactinomyces albus]